MGGCLQTCCPEENFRFFGKSTLSIFELFDPTAKGWGQKIFSTVDLFQTHIWAIRIRMFHFKNLQTADFENPGYGSARS